MNFEALTAFQMRVRFSRAPSSSKLIPTFYIFHGSDDCSVSVYDSKNLDKAVKAVKGKSNLKIVSGAIHGGAGVWSEVMKAVPAFKSTLSK